MSEGDDAPKRGDGNTNDAEKFIETQYQGRPAASPSQSNLAAVSRGKDPLIGSTVSGYVVKGKIGSGGMGIVYEGEQPVIGKRVAIKVLRPEIAEHPEQVKRLVEEARAVNTVGHRGIIDVFGFGEVSDGRQCIVMEFLDGESLGDLLVRNTKEHKAMPIAEVMVVLEELLSALGAAHGAGVVHRDLKPSNIFLCRQRDGTRYVKVLDFGIAKLGVHGNTPQTETSVAVGTPSYMAPEQARGGAISPAMDLYAVGILAFELITGKLPFTGSSVIEVLMKHAEEPAPKPSSLLMSVPDDVDELVLKLLEKKPADRYRSAEDVRVDVVRIRKALSQSTARRTELDSELERRMKTALQKIVVPESGSIDLSDGEDATLVPGKNFKFKLPSADEQAREAAEAPSSSEDVTVPPTRRPSRPPPARPDDATLPLNRALPSVMVRASVMKLDPVTSDLPAPARDLEVDEPTVPPQSRVEKSKAPLIVIGVVVLVAVIGLIAYSKREQPRTGPDVIELPIPPEPVIAGPPDAKPPAPVKPAEPVVARPPDATKPQAPAVVKPAEPPVAAPTGKMDPLIERFTRIEAALSKRTDKQIELTRARKYLEKLKSGSVTPEQRTSVESTARDLESSLTQ